ncbi:hypothetical protein Bbelb_336420 [Branchiostoma belcheri]|nr:hypothetical protein Bbelb_336420 [Branchiostoma belcheri]
MDAVRIDKNPWRCDCNMAPFRRSMTGFRPFEKKMVCSWPTKFSGQKLIDINPNHMTCEVLTTPTVMTYTVRGQMNSKNNLTMYNSTTPPSTSHYHWLFIQNAGITLTAHPVGTTFTTVKPENKTSHESDPSFVPNPVLIASSVCGPIVGIALIVTSFLAVWYKRRANIPPHVSTQLALQPNHLYEDVDTQNLPPTNEGTVGGKHIEDPNVALTERNINTIVATVHAVAGHHEYEDVDQHIQTGQGQSQAITESNTNTIATVTTSDHDHQYEDMSQHTQTGQGQSQAIIESNTNTTAADVVASGHYHDKSLDTRNVIYTTEEPASESNPVYKECRNGQTDQAQSQNNTDDTMDTRNLIYATEQAAADASPAYEIKNDQTSQAQSQFTSLHETVKTTSKNPKYESAGAEPDENKALVPQNRNIRHVSPKHQYESLQPPSSGINADPLSTDSQPPLYADVDSSRKSPKPLKNTGLKSFDENKSFGTGDNITPTKDDPPPLPPRKDTDALSVHMYEDVDSPRKSPKPLKNPGLKSLDDNKSFGTANNITPSKGEPPPLPPPRKDTDALSVHMYEDVDSPQKRLKPLKEPGLKSFDENNIFGTANNITPSKGEPPPLPPRKDTDALSVHMYEDVDSPQKRLKPLKEPSPKSLDDNKSFGTGDNNTPTKDEPPPLSPPRNDTDALSVHSYEDVDSPQKRLKPLKEPSPKSFGKGDNNTHSEGEPPPLPPRNDTDPLSADSKSHSYEDVDSPQKSHKPLKDPGLDLKSFDNNKSFGTANNNIPTKGEPPPLPPHRNDTDALSVHLYEDVDSPQKNLKPKHAGLKNFAKSKIFKTGNKNIPTKDEPPPLPPHGIKADPLSPVSQPHLYKDVDSPQKSPKSLKEPSPKSFDRNLSFASADKNRPTKDTSAIKLPSKKSDGDNKEQHNYENHDLK